MAITSLAVLVAGSSLLRDGVSTRRSQGACPALKNKMVSETAVVDCQGRLIEGVCERLLTFKHGTDTMAR